MFESEEGLTRTYNRFHDPAEYAQGISKLRDLRVKLDETVALAYEWIDVDLGHDFHSTKQGIRFTISPAARQEVLDRLLELNHQRYREEVEQGLHELIARKAGRRSARQRAAEGTPPPASLLEV